MLAAILLGIVTHDANLLVIYPDERQAASMNILFVVNHPRDWPFEIEGARVVTAREYLTDPAYSEPQSYRIVNLCRTDRYQGRGYYVSLLAEARGHRALPEVKTLGDLQAQHLDRLLGGQFIDQLQRALSANGGDACTVDAWFGRDPQRRNESLAQQLFAALRVPLLRATFDARGAAAGAFAASRIASPHEVPPDQRAFLLEAATEYVRRGNRPARREAPRTSPAIAILYDEDEPEPPSNRAALDKLPGRRARSACVRRSSAATTSSACANSTRSSSATRPRSTTTRTSSRAARPAEGLVVIDDPDSILKCTNKVYLNELLSRPSRSRAEDADGASGQRRRRSCRRSACRAS